MYCDLMYIPLSIINGTSGHFSSPRDLTVTMETRGKRRFVSYKVAKWMFLCPKASPNLLSLSKC